MNQANYYKVLGVDEDATLSVIKAAHRKKALKYHPDKSASDASTSNLSEEERDTAFKSIQVAWECLREASKRSDYDETLRRAREKNNSILSKAQTVKLSEMNCELCDVEDDEEGEEGEHEFLDRDIDDANSDASSEGDRQKLYSYQCRCGDIFEILEEELQEESNLLECQSCCLTINIIANE